MSEAASHGVKVQEKTFKALGQSGAEFEGIETIPLQTSLAYVSMETSEVTAVCPVTGQPDWYSVDISFQPNRKHPKGIESKTLKLYLQSYRNVGIFAENFADRILNDLVAAIDPDIMTVNVNQAARGGISINATAEYENREKPGIPS